MHDSTADLDPTVTLTSADANNAYFDKQLQQLANDDYENAIEDEEDERNDDSYDDSDYVEIEAQGVLMYDKISGEPSHVSLNCIAFGKYFSFKKN